jgi:hypothetical protein
MTRDDIKEEFGVTCPHWEPCDCLVDGADFMADEILKLRAAIDRVRALHDYPFRGDRVCIVCREEDGIPMPHPCPTLRALDGDA